MTKQINIENLNNEGTINFYVGDESPNKKSVYVPAVDKYSSPLGCEVSLTPWGKSHFRVTATVENSLISQKLYQKYLTYNTEAKAKEAMDKIVIAFNEIKEDAEINLKHSAFLIPSLWKKLSNISEDAVIGHNDPDDASIRKRFDNNLFKDQDNATPYPTGWVGDDSHFPTHTRGVAPSIADIVDIPRSPKMGSAKGSLVLYSKGATGMIKRASK